MILAFLIFSLFFSSIISECPNGSFSYLSNCYIYNTNASGFAKAEITCQKIGGHLVSIHDAFTNAVLGQESPGGSTEDDFWIGANTLMSHGNWSWTDGSSVDFLDWDKGEPKNISGSSCAALSIVFGYWRSQDCFQNKSFICSIPEQIAPTNPQFFNCTEGWTYFEPTHSCYGGKYGGYKANWSAAESYCQGMDASLPTIHSYEEFEFLMTFMYEDQAAFWSGIYSVDGEKTWESADKSPVDFFHWCSSRPSNATGQQCVYYTCCAPKGCFWDNICSLDLRTICKRPVLS